MSPEVVGLLASADRFLLWFVSVALWAAVGFVGASLFYRLQDDPGETAIIFWQGLSLAGLLTLAALFTVGLAQRGGS